MLFIFIMYIYAWQTNKRTNENKSRTNRGNRFLWVRIREKRFRACEGRFRASQTYFTFCSHECFSFVLFSSRNVSIWNKAWDMYIHICECMNVIANMQLLECDHKRYMQLMECDHVWGVGYFCDHNRGISYTFLYFVITSRIGKLFWPRYAFNWSDNTYNIVIFQ